MATTEPSVFFNPLQPGYMDDPYSHFTEMREHDPVHESLMGPWILFRYDDVFEVLRDPTMSVDDTNAAMEDNERAALFEALEGLADGDEISRDSSMLNSDPPDHTRLRRLVSKAFTPKSIEALRPEIQRLVDDALDRIEAADGGDVVGDLAFPLPFDVITEMLGMPEGDRDKIRDWSGALVKTLDPVLSEEDARAAFAAAKPMGDHIDAVIEWKRANPADDLLTRLIEAEEDGDRLSEEELRDQVALLFIAGHETTVNLIGTGIWELLRHPDQIDRWLHDESVEATAVDEMLRFVSPVQFSRRITTDDVEVAGRGIPKGSFIVTGLAAANRDPEKWGETADELDLGRADAGQHVSFGSGAHYCLGASLAKLEARVAISSFLRRFPNATPDGTHEWNGRLNLRGLERFPVRV